MLVGVLGVAAVSKLTGRSAWTAFVDSLRPLAGRRRATTLAATMIVVELTVSVLLVVPGTAAIALAIAVALLTAYGIGIELARIRGVRLTCRCFGGTASARLGRAEAVRNFALAGGAAVTLVLRSVLPAASGPALLVAAVVGALLAITIVRWDDIHFVLGGADRSPAN